MTNMDLSDDTHIQLLKGVVRNSIHIAWHVQVRPAEAVGQSSTSIQVKALMLLKMQQAVTEK